MSSVSLDRRSLLALVVGIGTSATLISRGLSADVSDDDLASDPLSLPRGNVQLQTIGALGVGHIQSTLGLIGVLADSLNKEIYSLKQVEDLMNGTVNGLESPKRLLRRLQDSKISAEDAEFLDRMIGVFNALQREAKALTVYAKSRKQEDGTQFERARKLVLKKLAELTQQEELQPIEAAPGRSSSPKSGRVGESSD